MTPAQAGTSARPLLGQGGWSGLCGKQKEEEVGLLVTLLGGPRPGEKSGDFGLAREKRPRAKSF
jgi:hypothetical protein